MRRFQLLFGVVLLSLILAAVAHAETINASVAISLKETITQIAKAYQEKTGDKVELTFGSSGQLMAQIKSGAPIDLFISAANKQVDDLAKDGLIVPESRQIVAGNAMVLIIPASSKLKITDWKSLVDPSIKHIATGEPKTVPAGQYAMQTLKSLQLMDELKDRIVYGNNVRQVLTYVETGEADAGLVYLTDAMESGDKVKVIATASPRLHEPIVYPAAVIKASKKQEAVTRFLVFMATKESRAVMTEKGFTPFPSSAATSAPAGIPTTAPTTAPAAGALMIELDAEKKVSLSASDLLQLPRMKIKATEKDGSEHQYEGVAVEELLRRAGQQLGVDQLRGKALTRALIIEAADGYRVLFALPELSKDFTDRDVILADRRDGEALSPYTGPFQIIAPSEKQHARWIRQVVAFKLIKI